MRIAVCDDVKEYRENVKGHIKAYNNAFEIVEYADGSELLQDDMQFDLLFLDIEMPGTDGMSTAKKIRERGDEVRIVFLTSHDEFVYDAYEVKAFHFLRKPVEPERLERVLKLAETELTSKELVKLGRCGESCYVKLKDIVYLEAYGDGVYFYDRFGNVYEERRETLKHWCGKLKGKGFAQIHRTYLISMQYIERFGTDRVKLKGVERALVVSRRYAPGFKENYFQFVDENGQVI